MALVIRLRKLGAKHQPFFRIAVAEATSGRDGRFVEEIGWYDPKKASDNSKVNVDRARHWLSVGAQPSETVRNLLKKHGVLGTQAVAPAPVAESALAPAPATDTAPAPAADTAPEPEQPSE